MPIISPTAISPHRIGKKFDWSSYWETRNPTNLIVTGMRDTEIDFSWTDNSAGDCTFTIYRSTDGINYLSIGTTVAGDTTYTATGLTAGNLYYFYIKGVKSGNESTATNIYDTRFKITVDTTKTGSAADTFVLPVGAKGAGSFYVDWGDGSAVETFTTTGNKSHTYAAQGSYQIKVIGSLSQISFANTGDKAKLISIDNWGNLKWSSFWTAFFGCSNMVANYIDCPNLSANIDLGNMFRECLKFNGTVSYFDTSNTWRLERMFLGCVLFNKSVSNFNTAKVKSFDSVFNGCTAFKQSLASFSLVSATNISNMLNGCDINLTGTTANYDATLVAWAAQDVPSSLNFHGGTSKYSVAGGGAAARASLIADDLWTITDGGQL